VGGLKAQLDNLGDELQSVRALQADHTADLERLQRQVTAVEEVSKQTQEQLLEQDKRLENGLKPFQSRLSVIEGAVLRNDDRLRQIEGRLKLASPPPLTFGGSVFGQAPLLGQQALSSGAVPGPTPAASATPESELYDQAFSALSQGNPNGAVSLFQRVLKAYPASSLAPKAQYFLAKSYYQLRDYERAIVEFDKFARGYPASELVPSAYLRQGEAFEELGDFYDANIVYKKILKDFPTSQASVQAKTKLQAIDQRLKR
jgi:tol-pal system protein YbgF